MQRKGIERHGYGKLQNGYGKSSIEEYFKDCDDIDFLDAIDYFFYLIDKKIRTIKPEYQYDYDADGAINAAIAELNYRFKQHNLGYEFANSQIITIDSTFLHKTAVKPTLKLLFEEGFEGSEDEIRNAYERRRKGDNKNAILEAGKSRLLTTLLLYRSGFYVGKYVSLEAKIAKNKDLYYEALAAAQPGWHDGTEDVVPFIKYLLGTILAAYKDFEDRMALVEIKLPALEMVRRASHNKIGRFNKQDIRELCPTLSDSSIEGALRKLVASGELRKEGKGKNTCYIGMR